VVHQILTLGGVCPVFDSRTVDLGCGCSYPCAVNFRNVLQVEFEARRQRNRRYSLRAFARYLGTDHATLSQILRGRRSLSPQMVQRFGRRLRLPLDIIQDACAQQQGEAVLRLAESPSFRTHSRWIATRTGLSLDAVNASLHRLLRQGDIVMNAPNHWTTTRKAYA
jgi:transcriptional regulator with XRE-family HTH domain